MNNYNKNKNQPSEDRKNRTNSIIVAFIAGIFSVIAAIVGSNIVNIYINETVSATVSALIPTETNTAINIATFTIIPSVTFTYTPTPSATNTLIPDPTITIIPTSTLTSTFTPSATNTSTATFTVTPSVTFTYTPTPSATNTLIPDPTITRRPPRAAEPTITLRPPRNSEPTPQGPNGTIEIEGLEITIEDYSFTRRNNDNPQALFFAMQFANLGEEEVEVRFSESDLEGMSDDGDFYTDFVTSLRNYVENSNCVYIGEWTFPDPDITLFIPQNDREEHEFYLHRDGDAPQNRCPQSAMEYSSRVSIGTNWVEIEIPIEYQRRGDEENRINIVWRLPRND